MAKPDYPKTIMEFAAKFHSDEICYQYLIENRWPDGFTCPQCNNNGGWWLEKYHRFECSSCHRQTSPLAGTLFHGSHLPIRLWFWAAYLVSTHTPGISAVQLQRQLGISKIDTAWFVLHRFREGMVGELRTPLSGIIEADETHIGGPAKGMKGRGVVASPNKSLIVGAVEIVTHKTKNGNTREKAGRLRLQVIRAASEKEIKKFLNHNVTLGSTIKSDGWKGYSHKGLNGYKHLSHIQQNPQQASELAPHIHRAFSNLKTWINGIHHGVDPKYLQSYLDEFVFRYNRREYPMSSFRSLLTIMVSKPPLTLVELTKP
jgi:hypothetical protein